jgi:hypothetical protein
VQTPTEKPRTRGAFFISQYLNLSTIINTKQSVELTCNYVYALIMKTQHAFLLLASAAMIYTGITHAQFYKSVDEQGNIVYSDTPTPGAEQLTPPPISTVDTKPILKESSEEAKNADPAGTEEPAKKPPTIYTKFSIVTPKNNDTIWDNNGSVPVSLSLQPPLDIENGHSVWVYVDGTAMVKKSQSLTQPLSGLDRGTHKIRAEIRDQNRKTLKRTQNITLYMKKMTALPRTGP